MIYIIVVCLIILLLSCIIPLITNVHEAFSNSSSSQVSFVTRKEFQEKMRFSIKYFLNLTPLDLIARNAQTKEDYIKKYSKGYRKFTKKERKRLKAFVRRANGLLDAKAYHIFRAIPWKFAKVHDTVEYGYPHTLYDTIIITSDLLKKSDSEIIKTLLHEKIHVFQRFHPIAMSKLLSDLTWEPLNPTALESIKPILYNVRSNPDLDNHVYVYGKDKLVLLQLYTSNKPKSLQESRTIAFKLDNPTEKLPPISNSTFDIPEEIVCQLEHPYEIMACIIAHILTDENIEKLKSNRTVGYIIQWMNKYFTHSLDTK